METERDKSLAEYCGYLRAEAAMVDAEEGTDCTTRAALLRGAANEIERQRKCIKQDAELYVKALYTITDLERRLSTAESVIENGIPKEEEMISLQQRLAAAEAERDEAREAAGIILDDLSLHTRTEWIVERWLWLEDTDRDNNI